MICKTLDDCTEIFVGNCDGCPLGETQADYYLQALAHLLEAIALDDAIAVDLAAQWFINHSSQTSVTKADMNYAAILFAQLSRHLCERQWTNANERTNGQ